MPGSTYYPYRSEAARDRCFAYLDSLAVKRWPSDSREQIVSTSYGDTFVRITGPANAPPLIVLHGAGSTSLMWSPNVTALAAEFRTIAVDQVGEYGKSLCTMPIRKMADFMTWLDELFDGLELVRGINLLGMSYGGALAAQYALHAPPRRLDRLVLLAPGSTVLHTSLEFWARILTAATSRRRLFPWFMRWIFPGMAKQDPAWIDGIVEEFFLNSESVERHRPVFPPVINDAAWRSLTVPTLFLVGEREVIYSPRKAVARLKRVAPCVTAELVPGAGHDLTIIQADAVNRRVLDFLRQPSRAAVTAA